MFDIELGTLFQDLECSHDHIYQAYFSLLVNSMQKKKKMFCLPFRFYFFSGKLLKNVDVERKNM